MSAGPGKSQAAAFCNSWRLVGFTYCNSMCVHSAVLLLLLGDSDPPTLLETCRWLLYFLYVLETEGEVFIFYGGVFRLLLTCVSQDDVCSLWLQRLRQQTSVCSNLCFIMSSSTNSTFDFTDFLLSVCYILMKVYLCDIARWLLRTQLLHLTYCLLD